MFLQKGTSKKDADPETHFTFSRLAPFSLATLPQLLPERPGRSTQEISSLLIGLMRVDMGASPRSVASGQPAIAVSG